jgi:hypothetical protein
MNTKTQKSDVGSMNSSRTHQEYSRILTAAVINMQFRQLLLTNPGKAIETGYGGEVFYLAREEKKRVAAIRATTLADFASQLNQVLSQAPAALAAD